MNIVTQIVLPAILAFMMFSMGLELTSGDFRRVFLKPKPFLTGLVLQFVFLPILAFLIASVFLSAGLSPVLAVGLVVISACPGGVTSNMMTLFAKGDTALSVSLTAISSLLCVVTLPIITNFALSNFKDPSYQTELPLLQTIAGIFAITTIPVLLGMAVRMRFPNWTMKWSPMTQKIAGVLFVLIAIAAVYKDWGLLLANYQTVAPATLALNLSVILLAWGASKALRLQSSERRAILYECGFQNGTLAIFVTLSLMGNEEMMLPAGIYVLVMFFTGVGLLSIHRRKSVTG